MDFSTRLKQLRKSRNWSQSFLCKKIGVNQSMVAQYESGKSLPNIQIFATIAETFGVSIDYLLGKNDDIGKGYEADLMKVVNAVRPKLNGVELNDEEWEMVNVFLKSVVRMIERQGEIRN